MLPILLRASLDGAILIAIVWILGRALPRLPAATRTILWWCVAAKFVVALVWTTPVFVRVLPAAATVNHDLTLTGSLARAALSAPSSPVTPDTVDPAPPPCNSAQAGCSSPQAWSVWLVAVWASGVLLMTGVGVRRGRRTVSAVKASVPAPDDLEAMTADLADRLGVRRLPAVRLSNDVETPLVTGLTRPVILLPMDRFAASTDRQRRMTLCHELAHLRRGDLWLGCIPAVAERLFFFHPLVHLAVREYAVWREAACDAIVIETLGAGLHEYGRLLLDLGISRRRTALVAAGASWSFLNLKRRIAMLRYPSTQSFRSRIIGTVAVGLTVVAVVPMQLAARHASRVSVENAPSPAGAPQVNREQKKEGDLNFVLFLDDNHTTMSGSIEDIERARRVKRAGEQVLWFRRSGREYVIRDPEMLRHVWSIWQPVNAIGDAQGKLGGEQGILGGKQGDLGARQGELGTQQGRLGTRQGILGERQAMLAAREDRTRTAAERQAFENERRQIEAEMTALDRQMRRLDAQMRELDKPMQELGDQIDVLSKQMDVLDAEMKEAVRKAEDEMRVLLDRALTSGAAQPVK